MPNLDHEITLQLFDAVKRGDIEEISGLWTEDVDNLATEDDDDGRSLSLLGTAVANKQLAALKWLVDHGMEIGQDWVSEDDPLLAIAASVGALEIVTWLVEEQGVSVHDMCGINCYYTPLHEAAEAGHLSVVNYLIEKGSNTELMGQHGETPLYTAAHYSHSPEVVFALLQFKKVEKSLDLMQNYREWFKYFSSEEQSLLEKLMGEDDEGHYAAVNEGEVSDRGVAIKCEEGVQKEADSGSESESGEEGNEEADSGSESESEEEGNEEADSGSESESEEEGNEEADSGSESESEEDAQEKLQSSFFDAIRTGNFFEVKRLVAQGADIHALDRSGRNSLIMAADLRNLAHTITYLLAAGVRPDVVANGGYTALMAAAKNGNLNIVQQFLDAKVDIHRADEEGKTALIHAMEGYREHAGHIEVVRCLISRGADVNVADKNGNTPLMHAVASRDFEMIKLLLNSGANVRQKNKAGFTAFDYAYRSDTIPQLSGAEKDFPPFLGYVAQVLPSPRVVRYLARHYPEAILNIDAIGEEYRYGSKKIREAFDLGVKDFRWQNRRQALLWAVALGKIRNRKRPRPSETTLDR